MSRSSSCRLTLVFAAEAPVAVILRRGPRNWVELVKWNTRTDAFDDGQWLHGRVYGERCGLSPAGRLFVYFAAKYGRVDRSKGYADTFTAVSKPPYFTALAMWPEGSTWGGGGRFIDNATLRLAYGAHGTRAPDGTTELYMPPMPACHPEHQPRGLRIETDLDRHDADIGFRAVEIPQDMDWFGNDHSGRPVFTRSGALCRLDRKGREVLLRDFSVDRPRGVVAPRWAGAW